MRPLVVYRRRWQFNNIYITTIISYEDLFFSSVADYIAVVIILLLCTEPDGNLAVSRKKKKNPSPPLFRYYPFSPRIIINVYNAELIIIIIIKITRECDFI